jgi:hypothetical protein
MRTLGEIIESAKDGYMPTHEECYWAMLAFDALHAMATMDMNHLVMDAPNPFNNPEYRVKEQWGRSKRAMAAVPKDWIGPNNDPANPEYQQFRNVSKKLIDKAVR